MKRNLFILFLAILTSSLSAQITRQNELFKDVTILNNKVAFVKEVKFNNGKSAQENYVILREWAKENYGKDPFVSSVRYDSRKSEIVAKSRVELVLPENSQGVRERMVMRYRADAFIFEDKCVLEISDLSYLHENAKSKKLPRVIRAEDFVTNEKVAEDSSLKELRINARKSTLYFLNTLGKDFEEQFGYLQDHVVPNRQVRERSN